MIVVVYSLIFGGLFLLSSGVSIAAGCKGHNIKTLDLETLLCA